MYVKVSVWTHISLGNSHGNMPKSGIGGSCDCMFSILRNCQAVFQSGLGHVIILPAIYKGSNFSRFHQDLLLLVFLIHPFILSFISSTVSYWVPMSARDYGKTMRKSHKKLMMFSQRKTVIVG